MTQRDPYLPANPVANVHTKVLRYTLTYVLISFIWIFLSDEFVHLTVHNPLTETWVSVMKGWLFVIVTASVLYVLMKRLAASVRGYETSYEIVFNHASDSIFLADSSGKILDANERAEDLLGCWRSEILQMSMPEFLYPWESGGISTNIDALKSGQPLLAERSFIRKDGRKIILESSIQMLPDGRVLAIARDITERKRAEEELYREEQRRYQLERQLMQSQRVESLGALAGGIAHDFNNILNIIGGNAALLPKRVSDSAKFYKSIEDISAASDRGAFLVKQLLTFARKTGSAFETIDINDVINEIASVLRETFPKNITVTENLATDLPKIFGDPMGLHLAILNLCLNARDAMPKGGSLVLTTARPGPDRIRSLFRRQMTRTFVAVDIADTGIGMNEKTRESILNPLASTNQGDGDTGLGLSLVQSIVQGHQGMIDVQSEPGKGTTFAVYLPALGKDERSRSQSSDDSPILLDGTETVLLIEDEEMLADIVKSTLESRGYTVLCALDGEEGLNLFSQHRTQIAAVITDQGLPKMEGTEVIKRLKKLDPRVRVILASGFIDSQTRSEMLKVGADSFMQKPYSPGDVLKTVRKVINLKN